MLTELYIQNIAVIQKADISFTKGLNIFTGETGAGKTILISAIDAVLGERTSKDIIRTGEEKAFVSALFDDVSETVKTALLELGYSCEDSSVLITREIASEGKNVCKINGMPVTVSMLKEISPLLIHIHGQRDSHQLLSTERHVELIDVYGELSAQVLEYSSEFSLLQKIKSSISALNMDEAQKNQRTDMLRFQIAEIEDASLEDTMEEEALLSLKQRIRNSEKILSALSQAYIALSGDGESVGMSELIEDACTGASIAAGYMEELQDISARLEEIRYELSDFSSEIRGRLDSFDFDPSQLDSVEYRLNTIYKLKRKYGADIAEVIAYCEKSNSELISIESSGQQLKVLEEQLQSQTDIVTSLAKELCEKRVKAAEDFLKKVIAELVFLDMPQVELSICNTPTELTANGANSLEFFIVTNMGELPKPLSKIASGGEMARIMLSIKNVLASKDDIDTLIFDEIDTGVSGRAAQKIGQKLAQVSRTRQVICVTHLAQVAAFADHHLYISKTTDKGRTFTSVQSLGKKEKIVEISRITSGDLMTPLALQNASELIEHSNKLKMQ